MTQMKYRIYEGFGEALYFIGVNDDGTLLGLNEDEYILSVKNLELIAGKIDCTMLTIKITHMSFELSYKLGLFLLGRVLSSGTRHSFLAIQSTPPQKCLCDRGSEKI